jgi:hypothetical protein
LATCSPLSSRLRAFFLDFQLLHMSSIFVLLEIFQNHLDKKLSKTATFHTHCSVRCATLDSLIRGHLCAESHTFQRAKLVCCATGKPTQQSALRRADVSAPKLARYATIQPLSAVSRASLLADSRDSSDSGYSSCKFKRRSASSPPHPCSFWCWRSWPLSACSRRAHGASEQHVLVLFIVILTRGK